MRVIAHWLCCVLFGDWMGWWWCYGEKQEKEDSSEPGLSNLNWRLIINDSEEIRARFFAHTRGHIIPAAAAAALIKFWKLIKWTISFPTPSLPLTRAVLCCVHCALTGAAHWKALNDWARFAGVLIKIKVELTHGMWWIFSQSCLLLDNFFRFTWCPFYCCCIKFVIHLVHVFEMPEKQLKKNSSKAPQSFPWGGKKILERKFPSAHFLLLYLTTHNSLKLQTRKLFN